MAEIPVNFLLEKLNTFLAKEAQLLGGMGGEIEEIRGELRSIKAFLKDADRKKNSSEVIKEWVGQVRSVAYDVEDVIDEFVLRFGRRNEGGGIKNFFSTLLSAMKQPVPSHDLANSIQVIKRRINGICERSRKYEIELKEEDNSSEATIRQWQYYKEAKSLDEAEAVGIKKDVEVLMKKLMGVTGNDPKTFISVYGMGGVGKSTLVRKVYNDPKVKEHFSCVAWIPVSQTFNTKDLLKFMLIEFGNIREQNSSGEAKAKKKKGKKRQQNSSNKAKAGTLPSKKEIEGMNQIDLKRNLEGYLQGKRFVLVLDDVWDKSVCIDINLALPEDSNGSKIIITTRIQSLASELEGTGSINTNTHELKPLGDEAARELLCRKAFPGRDMSLEFEDVCRRMLQRCGGLPLAIVALGGILNKKGTVLEWEKVHDNLMELLGKFESTSKGSSTTGILKLSYHDLPLYLKPCFLYCALFPEDHLIKRNKLIRLWVAEGFIKEESGMTKEEVGEGYLMKLIDRSMLQTAEASIDGRVKSCRIHDLMRDLAVSVSQEEEFLFILEKKVSQKDVIKPRRMSVIGKNEENGISSTAGIQHLRSLLFFDVGCMRTRNLISYSAKLTLLRVLDLEGADIRKLPRQIAQLLHLRYLCLKGNRSVRQLPRSIGRLQNLETLDIRGTAIHKLPKGITRLKNLRHLCMREKWNLILVEVPRGICNLRCLQTLIGYGCPTKGISAEIGNLELKRLDIVVDNKLGTEEAQELCAAIGGMTHLFRLSVVRPYSVEDLPFGKTLLEHPPPHLRMLELEGLSEWPLTLGSFNNLIRLTLWGGSLREDPFPSLSSLPSLAVLHLVHLHNLKSLQCGRSGFSQLKELKLKDLWNLEEVIFEEGCMPSLKRLEMVNCRTLKMVPRGIKHLKLGELVVGFMPLDFGKRLEEGGEDRCKVQHIPLITVGPLY